MVGLILSGRLAWKGHRPGCRRYVDLLVDADEVMRVLQGDAQPLHNLRKEDIIRMMPGMRLRVVSALVQAGHLMAVTEFCPTVRRRIELVKRESLEAFKDRYLTLAEVCHERKLSYKAAKERLDVAGFKPAFDPRAMGSVIYERSGTFDEAVEDRLPPRSAWAGNRRASCRGDGPGSVHRSRSTRRVV